MNNNVHLLLILQEDSIRFPGLMYTIFVDGKANIRERIIYILSIQLLGHILQ